MSAPKKPSNRLLAALKTKTYKALIPKLESVELVYEDIIYNVGSIINHVYFPESGIISLLSAVDVDSTLEVGIVGSEGMVGLPVFLGDSRSDTKAIVQGTGNAVRMRSKDLIAECNRRDSEMPAILRKFTHSFMAQISQSAVCNRFHTVEARLARWLLMTHDRMRSDDFLITQDFMSNMIGVRREAVSKAAGVLAGQKIISYSRGHVSIIKRRSLEIASCACYTIISR